MINAGAVQVTSSDATIDIAGNTLQAGIAASPSAGTPGAGGTLTMSAGQITMGGGTLRFYQMTVNGTAQIFGSGTIINPSFALAGASLTTGGSGKIVADGGTLTINSVDATTANVLSVSASFVIDGGAALTFGANAQVTGGSISFNNAAGSMTTNSTTAGDHAQFHLVTGSTYLFNATLSNLAIGPTKSSSTGASIITLNGQTITSASIVGTTINAVTAGATYQFNVSGANFTGDNVFFSGGNLWVDVVCYAAGTGILTDDGEVAVEDLRAGDTVMTLEGDRLVPQTVKWLGHRRVDLTRHRQPNLAAPVRIQRGAFGDNKPHRDLVLSPDHSVYIDGKLIPAKLLINGMTIVHELATPAVDYFHVELASHAILVAEGLPAESYLNTGNRAFFANSGLALVLHPEFEVNASLSCWETDACAPLTVAPDLVEPVWRLLADRAAALGYTHDDRTTTQDPDLHLMVNGRRVRPLSTADNRYVFAVPAGADSVRLASRATVPSELRAYVDDWRHLGVAIRRITVSSNEGRFDISPDHPELTSGWHGVERDDANMWRWMNGDAVLPLPKLDGLLMVEVQVGMSMTHVLPEAAANVARLAA